MKYIDAERLRAEIENRIDELNPKVGMFGDKPLRSVNPKTFPRESELENVLGIIDSLQQEQPEPSGYDKALLEVKSKVDELYEEASIGLSEYDSGLYNGIAETCMKLRGFIKARLDSEEQPEVELEKITKYSRIKELPEGFEKEWLCYYHKNPEYNSTKFFHLPLIEREYIIARHFYELGLNERKEDKQ